MADKTGTGTDTATVPDVEHVELDRRSLGYVEVRTGDHPDIPVVIPGMVEGHITLLAGAGGSGKTTLLQQIIHHVSCGHQLGSFEMPDRSIRSWMLLLEDTESMTQDRSLRTAEFGKLTDDRTGESLVRVMYGRDWDLLSLRVALADARERGEAPGLVAIDHFRLIIGPMPRVLFSSPNDWERHCWRTMRELAEEYGTHFLVLTHLNKSGTVSGTTDMVNTVDSAFFIEYSSEDRSMATLSCLKMRLSPETDYALSKSASGAWGFTDEVFVSQTQSAGIAHAILNVLRNEGPKSLSQLEAHHAIPGLRRGIQEALTRSRKKGWVAKEKGHWIAVMLPGDEAMVAPSPSVCPGFRNGQPCTDPLTPGLSIHFGCDPEPTGFGPGTIGAEEAPAPAQIVPEGQADRADLAEQADAILDQADDEPTKSRWSGWGITTMRASVLGIDKGYHPILRVDKDERTAAPWTIIRPSMDGEPNWVAPGWTQEKFTHENGKHEKILIVPEALTTGQLVAIDRNGSYPSAGSSCKVAPNKLLHTGALEGYDTEKAGIYLVSVPEWTETSVPHPLGRIGARVGQQWITTPHMALLHKLWDQGRITAPLIHDSWTGVAHSELFTGFYTAVREARKETVGTDEYGPMKLATNLGMQSMWWDKQSPIWRPDWNVSLSAEAAVRHWAVADRAIREGAKLVRLSKCDQAVFWRPDGTPPKTYRLGTGFGEVKVASIGFRTATGTVQWTEGQK